jgi:hypothetical protein
VAPKPYARLALLALTLGGCGGKKPNDEQTVDLATIRAHRDSLRQAAVADSLVRAKWTGCSDSIVTAMGKTAAGKKKLQQKLPEGMIRPEVMAACGQPPAPKPQLAQAPAPAPAAAPPPAPAAVEKPDTTRKLTPAQQRVASADSVRRARAQAKQDSLRAVAERTHLDSLGRAQFDSVRAESLKVARETEVLRETFTYSGGTRDPFLSLISEDKVGPEFGDLLLVGIYLDLRRSSNSLAVLRDKTTQKRYKLRVGDRLGRLKVTQIRQTDVVFTVEDIGFERQETLSLRKREADTQ